MANYRDVIIVLAAFKPDSDNSLFSLENWNKILYTIHQVCSLLTDIKLFTVRLNIYIGGKIYSQLRLNDSWTNDLAVMMQKLSIIATEELTSLYISLKSALADRSPSVATIIIISNQISNNFNVDEMFNTYPLHSLGVVNVHLISFRSMINLDEKENVDGDNVANLIHTDEPLQDALNPPIAMDYKEHTIKIDTILSHLLIIIAKDVCIPRLSTDKMIVLHSSCCPLINECKCLKNVSEFSSSSEFVTVIPQNRCYIIGLSSTASVDRPIESTILFEDTNVCAKVKIINESAYHGSDSLKCYVGIISWSLSTSIDDQLTLSSQHEHRVNQSLNCLLEKTKLNDLSVQDLSECIDFLQKIRANEECIDWDQLKQVAAVMRSKSHPHAILYSWIKGFELRRPLLPYWRPFSIDTFLSITEDGSNLRNMIASAQSTSKSKWKEASIFAGESMSLVNNETSYRLYESRKKAAEDV
ncbi:hypothetical protein GJ496_010283 [Pomphorhynchus laevis]|nr:hypothetical protein GJ496_010283 [Pomphorhynchus laevis]